MNPLFRVPIDPGEPKPPRVVELADLPRLCPNTSDASILVHGSNAFVAYDLWPEEWTAALVKFEGLSHLIANGPNDEAFHNHPYYSLGLKCCALQEIVNSPWIQKVSAIVHKDGHPGWLPDARHFVLAFKETTVDVLASSFSPVGVFQGRTAAMSAAIAVAGSSETG